MPVVGIGQVVPQYADGGHRGSVQAQHVHVGPVVERGVVVEERGDDLVVGVEAVGLVVECAILLDHVLRNGRGRDAGLRIAVAAPLEAVAVAGRERDRLRRR